MSQHYQRKRSRKKSRSNSKYNNVLKRLKKLNAKEQRQAMSLANNAFIRQFISHIKQLRRAELSPPARKAFRKHKQAIRKLVNSRTSMSKRRTILCQRGRGAFYDFITSIPFLGQAIKYIGSL